MASGGRTLQAVVGGSSDIGVGTFDHTIQMQAKGQRIVGGVEIGKCREASVPFADHHRLFRPRDGDIRIVPADAAPERAALVVLADEREGAGKMRVGHAGHGDEEVAREVDCLH